MQKKTEKNKKGDGRWSSKMRHRQRNSYNVSFFRSIDLEFFFVCVLCVFWMDFLSIFGTGIYREESYVPPENVGTRWDVTTFFTKASSFYASSSSSFLRFWTFPPRFSRRLRRSRRRRGAKRPRRRRERVLAPFREVRRRF